MLLTEGAVPDDARGQRRLLNDGSYPGLAVFDADNDYFAVTVADGDPGVEPGTCSMAAHGGGTGAFMARFITCASRSSLDMFDAGGCNNYDLNVMSARSTTARRTRPLSAMSAFGPPSRRTT